MNEWIPVSTELPRPYTWVLLTSEYDPDWHFRKMEVAYLEDGEFMRGEGRAVLGNPIAWMPLPELYRGDIE